MENEDKYEVTGSAIPYYCEDLAMARRMALIFSTKTDAYVYIKKGAEVYKYAAGKEIIEESPK